MPDTILPAETAEVGGYPIVDGRIHNSEGCEINAALHCNLRCRACSHLSPVMPAWLADPARVARDLADLAEVYSCAYVRILGGEPLLHTRLPEVIAAIRASGITDRVTVCTNGLLLPSYDVRLWTLVDEIEISVYPGAAPSDDELDAIRRRAQDHAVHLLVRLAPTFRESYSEQGTNDGQLIERIYRTCEIVHVWRCHTVHEGVVYRCPQSYFLHRPGAPGAHLPSDGLPIRRDEDFFAELYAYLNSPHGPVACRWCLGTVGRSLEHKQMSRSRWHTAQDAPSEELVDLQLLADREHAVTAGPSGKVVLGDHEDTSPSWCGKTMLGDQEYAPPSWIRRRPMS